MNATQFAWLYLVENGMAGVERSYYGGLDIKDKRMKSKQFECGKGFRNEYMAEIQEHGVNWGKTISPISNIISQFQGTFRDSSLEEILEGTLVLNNGVTQSWFADAIPVMNVFEMMANVSSGETKFKEIFGEFK